MPTFDHLFDSAHEGNDESIWEVMEMVGAQL